MAEPPTQNQQIGNSIRQAYNALMGRDVQVMQKIVDLGNPTKNDSYNSKLPIIELLKQRNTKIVSPSRVVYLN